MTSEQIIGGRYRLSRDIGKGGMGKVWLADDLLLRRTVALKQLLPQLNAAELPERRQRAWNEALALGAVNYPSVVRIYDVLSVDDDPWIVMEYIEGPSLYDVVKGKLLDERAIAGIALPVLDGLREAHRCGVIHRDVKPTNILLSKKDDAVFLVDFGIAKIDGETSITQYQGGTPGTVDYVSPERLQGHAAGPASDLWSLGVTLFFALEGYSPFYVQGSHEATRWAILTRDTPKLNSSGILAGLVIELLNKDPAGRASADRARHVLRSIVDLPQASPRGSQMPTTKKIVPAPQPLSTRPFAQPTRPFTQPAQRRPAEPPLSKAQLIDAREAIRRTSPEAGAEKLLAMSDERAAQLLEGMRSREAGAHIQAIAGRRPATAGVILKILSSNGAGHAIDFVSAAVVASILDEMPVHDAVRILSRAEPRTAAQVVMNLPDYTSVSLIRAMPGKQAGTLLNFVWPATVARLFRESAELRQVLEDELDPALRAQVRRILGGYR